MEKDHLNIINKAKGNRLLNKTISKKEGLCKLPMYTWNQLVF